MRNDIPRRVDVPEPFYLNPLDLEKTNLMKRLLPYFQALLLACLLVANTTAQEDPPSRDVSELDVEDLQNFEEFRAHFRSEMQAFTKRYRTSKDKAEAAKTRPTVEIYHTVLSKFVAEATAEEADEILSWWWHGSRGRRDAELMSQLLIDHHIESEMVRKFAPRIGWNLEPEKAEPLLRRVIEASNVKSVQAITSFSLLQLLLTKAETAEGEAAESLQTEIESLTQTIKTEYAEFTDLADVSLGDRLEGIETARQLVVGKPVPDIVGSDLDGVEFKLSDYKGKVVLISFWGYW